MIYCPFKHGLDMAGCSKCQASFDQRQKPFSPKAFMSACWHGSLTQVSMPPGLLQGSKLGMHRSYLPRSFNFVAHMSNARPVVCGHFVGSGGPLGLDATIMQVGGLVALGLQDLAPGGFWQFSSIKSICFCGSRKLEEMYMP